MKAFYTLLNFSKGPIFSRADKSSFHIILLKGTAVKTSKEKYTLPDSLAYLGGKQTHPPFQPRSPPVSCLLFPTKEVEVSGAPVPGQVTMSDRPGYQRASFSMSLVTAS